MTKGDDAVRRKQNKAIRKKQQRKESSSNVSARVAAIIASKQRRKSGKRRQCQGMCFSLPTPDDPFNDRHGKKQFEIKETGKIMPVKALGQGKSAVSTKGIDRKGDRKLDLQQSVKKVKNSRNEHESLHTYMDLKQRRSHNSGGQSEVLLIGKSADNSHQGQVSENFECPSKFLILCLNAIDTALRHSGIYNIEEEKNPLFVNSWGIEFWKCYASGKDILETSGSSTSVEYIAWVVSTAADSIAKREKEGHLFTSPFLLYLVPSQEKAVEVRSVCKPLKALGIHAVSLHPGATLDHQINGLRSCEPEFLITTPERLLELVSMEAVDISGVSLLVIDGLEALCKNGHLANVNSIRKSISGSPRTVLFGDCNSPATDLALENLMVGPICRLSVNDSMANQNARIIQSLNVCTSTEEKSSKLE